MLTSIMKRVVVVVVVVARRGLPPYLVSHDIEQEFDSTILQAAAAD